MQDSLSTLAHSEAEELAWQLILAALSIVKTTSPEVRARYLSFDVAAHCVVSSQEASETTCLWLDDAGYWCRASQLPAVFCALFDLYLPVLGPVSEGTGVSSRRIAHLGQSVDAQIAARSGDSFYVTGEENRKHLHCLRALSDAVIVGAGTVVADNPKLTTRAVTGENPVRVIIDPQARLHEPLGLFDDAQARTILLHQSSADLGGRELAFGPQLGSDGRVSARYQVERWIVPDTDEQLSVKAIVELLARHGLQRLFIEGGGITVSKFFTANMLDRLHIAIAPLLAGKGVGALQLPGVDILADAHRPPSTLYRMGDDVLWDFDLSAVKICSDTTHERIGASHSPHSAQMHKPSVERIG